MPAISVIIPAFNSAEFLPAAIASVHRQTRTDYEIIVIDDGSTDGTPALMQAYPDVTYIWQENAERAAARNRGLRLARGDFVAFLDADDWWQPDFLAVTSRILEQQPQAVAAYTGYQLADRAGTLQPVRHGNAVQPTRILATLLDQNRFQPNCLLIRRVALGDDPFQTDLIPCEDWDAWLTLAQQGEFHGVATPLAVYRRHEGNTSADPARMTRARLAVLAHHFGPPSGDPAGWPALKRLGFANGYFWSARETLLAGDAAAADALLAAIVPIDATLFHRYDRLYELVAAAVPGPPGDPALRRQRAAAAIRRLEQLLDGDPALPYALAMTHVVLAQMAHLARDRQAAWRHLRRAARCDPTIIRAPRWHTLLPRLWLPRRRRA